MKHVGNFDTRNPDRLSENLDRLQSNIESEVAAIRSSYLLEPVLTLSNGSSPFKSLTTDQIVAVDTALGNVQLGLSKPPSPGFAAIAKRTAPGSVIVTPSGANGPAPVLINGAASKSYTAVGLYWLFFDGSNWFG